MKPVTRIVNLSGSSLVAFALGALIGLPNQALGAVPGDISPAGAPDGVITMPDALRALRMVVGLETPTPEERVTGDVAPLLVNGGQVALDANGQVLSTPDGRIGIGDAVVLARAGVGLIRLPEISPLAAARAGHTATLLPNGQVLITGGDGGAGPLPTVECFDSATRAFSPTSGGLTTARTQHTATLLPDQNTLLVAGRDSAGPTPSLDQIRLCGAPTSLSATLIAREEHAAVLLADGTLLITGGHNADGAILATAERYNPRTRTFTPLEPMTSARAGHSATLLSDGMVLIVGGVTSDTSGNSVVVASAERFDPTTGVFTPLSTPLPTPRAGHTATLLPDGRVLILGGADATPTVLASADIFDPSSGSFSASPFVLREARADHSATFLPDGRLLVVGGRNAAGPLVSTELIGPQADATAPTVLAVIPPDGATGVAPDSMVAVHFSEPLRTTSVSNATVGLVPEASPTSRVDGTVTPAESGLLAFFTPSAPLEPGTTYTLTLGPGISDTAGKPLATTTQSFTTNHPPVLAPIGNRVVNEGQVLQVTLSATDVDGDELTVSAVDLPQGATFDPAIRTFSWTPGFSVSSPTANNFFDVLFTVSDGQVGGTDSETVRITVNDVTTLTGITVTPANPTINVGGSQQFTATGSFNDGSTQALTNVLWSSDSAAATITNDGLATGRVAGSALITATSGSVSGSTTLTVANRSPLANAGPDQTAEATSPTGATVTLDGSGSTDPDGDSLSYSWAEAGDVVATGSTPTVPFSLGSHTITLTVADPTGATGTDTVVITVRDTTPPVLANVPTNQTATATSPSGALVEYPSPTASDAVSGTLPVSCDPPSGTTFPLGATTVTCTATDGAGNVGRASFTVTVVTPTTLAVTVLGGGPTGHDPLPGVRVLRHDPATGALLGDLLTNASGVADFGDIGATRATISIVTTRAQSTPPSHDIFTYVDVPAGALVADANVNNGLDRPVLANVDATLLNLPQGSVFANLFAGGFTSSGALVQNGSAQFPAYPIDQFQSDLKFSLLGAAIDATGAVVGCGSLVDLDPQTSGSAAVSIDAAVAPGLIPFTASEPAIFEGLTMLRRGLVWNLFNFGGQGGPATSGTLAVCPLQDGERFELSFRALETATSSSRGISLTSSVLPEALDVTLPALSIDTLGRSTDGRTINWQISGADAGQLDVAYTELNWAGTAAEYRWGLVAPQTATEVLLPSLPADLADRVPPATGTGLFLYLGGFDTITGFDDLVSQVSADRGDFDATFLRAAQEINVERSSRLLAVTVEGTGSGRVVSEPAAIDCGTVCTANLPGDTLITLTATPDPGSSFITWEGNVGCGSQNPCTFRLLDDVTSVTATFETIPNRIPVADAGPDQVVEATSPAGASVTLDGSGSTDPDGDPLTYTWRDAAGGTIETGVSPTLILPLGSHTITLTVTDPTGATGNDEVIITVQDTTPPDTIIDSGPADTLLITATFTFHSTETGSTFVCELDDGLLVACASPVTYTDLAEGPHTFMVRATDPSENPDPTPATHNWTVIPSTIFVDGTTGIDSSTCGTQAEPCRTVTQGLVRAVAGQTVSVAAGSYSFGNIGEEPLPLAVKSGVALVGAGADSTFLDFNSTQGNNPDIGITMADQATLSGFTFRVNDYFDYLIDLVNVSIFGTTTIRDNLFVDLNCARCLTVAIRVRGGGEVPPSPVISGNIFGRVDEFGNSEGFLTALLVEVFANPRVVANTFIGNDTGIRTDLGAMPIIEGNTLIGNYVGISLDKEPNLVGGGVGASNGGNTLGCNRDADMVNNTPNAISARNNAWDHVPPTTGSVLGNGVDIANTSQGSVDATGATQQTTCFNLVVVTAGSGSGSVGVEPGGIGSGSNGSTFFIAGTAVTLTAFPNTGSVFAGFSGGCASTATTCTFTITQDTVVTATFNNSTPTITSVNPTPVTFGVTPSGAVTIDGANFVVGATITVGGLSGPTVAGSTASASTPFVFVDSTRLRFYWPNTSLTPGSYGVRVTNPTAAGGLSTTLANGFTVNAAQPTIASVSPSSVTFGVDPSRSVTILGSNFVLGATITVGTLTGATVSGTTATAGTPYVYVSDNQVQFYWHNTTLAPGVYDVVVTNPVASGGLAATLTNGFTVIQSFTLTLTKTGPGTGTVSSSPQGVNCGTACTSQSFTFSGGTVVNLSASPLAGSNLMGWSGACLGTGICSVTMDANRSVAAHFNLQAVQISTGQAHSCALISNGTIKCWGSNSSGQVGGPSLSTVTGITTATSVEAGASHTCALLANRTVQCWGSNSSGQLGDGTTGGSTTTPVTVSGISNAVAISSGGSHTCAVLSTGAVQCWGLGTSGQLGNNAFNNSATSVTVSGITTAVAVSAGGAHSCAVLSTGAVQCWGSNGSGQLGSPTASSGASPVPLTVSGISTAVAVSADNAHTCATLSSGAVQCWGSNSSGQLGNGTTGGSSTSPVTVSGISTAVAVSAGNAHTCASLSSGAVSCWGDNDSGKLGNGDETLTDRASPVGVSGIFTATAVAAGGSHSCAVRSDGRVQCWGSGGFGQLGNQLAGGFFFTSPVGVISLFGFTLTVDRSASGVTITSFPFGIGCSDVFGGPTTVTCAASFLSGTRVTLYARQTANPADNVAFRQLTVGGDTTVTVTRSDLPF
ncbi:MAG: kelch repeat-containing protein [Nitrospirota bacterium]